MTDPFNELYTDEYKYPTYYTAWPLESRTSGIFEIYRPWGLNRGPSFMYIVILERNEKSYVNNKLYNTLWSMISVVPERSTGEIDRAKKAISW
jgi:hypothetical protein